MAVKAEPPMQQLNKSMKKSEKVMFGNEQSPRQLGSRRPSRFPHLFHRVIGLSFLRLFSGGQQTSGAG